MKYDFLISHLTLEEKASLMSGKDSWRTQNIDRLGIPSALMTDGPHGLRKTADGKEYLGFSKSLPATCYPSAAGLANSWDERLLEELGEHLGKEAVSEKIAMLLGPGINIKRNPLCGRNFEYFSEDPYLAGKLAAALIRGIQSHGIYACVKHFAANSQELHRMTVDSVMDERTLREIYLPAFEAAVKEGGVKAVMTCYNRVNGVYGSENMHLLKEILRGEWHFDGMTVSDWAAANDRVEGLKAGLTLEMPACGGITDRQVVKAIKAGELDERLLDEQADKLLQFVFSTEKALEKDVSYDRAEHHLFAQRVAEETAVLLKNEDNILPVVGRERKVAVIGSFAEKPRYQGGGSSEIIPTLMDNALDSLKYQGMNVIGYAQGFRRSGKSDKNLMDEALALAEKADTVLLYLGLDESIESECVDRDNMLLPDNQTELLKAVSAVNSSVAVVLSCGCVIEMQWHKYSKAIVHGYLGGQAGAMAMARILTGKVNPSGKLSETIPLNLASVPSSPYYPGTESTCEYREGIFVGYRYYTTAGVPTMYPFGFGLSYTDFEYSGLRIENDRVFFSVTNIGAKDGAEVAQLYISPNTNGIFRPKEELKGFERVYLLAGETKEICIQLNERSFALWSTAENGWVTEPGEYRVLVGASSTDIRLELCIEKEGAPVDDPYEGKTLDAYKTCNVQRVSDEEFTALLGKNPPRRTWNRHKPLEMNDCIAQSEYLKSGIGKKMYRAFKTVNLGLKAIGKGESANKVAFLLNMPFRCIGRKTGLMDDEAMKTFMRLVNGECSLSDVLHKR